MSGHIKNRVSGIKKIVKNLIRKAECKGDLVILRVRNIELTAELKTIEGKNQSRKKEIEMLKRTIEDLKKEILDSKKEKEKSYKLFERYEFRKAGSTAYNSSQCVLEKVNSRSNRK